MTNVRIIPAPDKQRMDEIEMSQGYGVMTPNEAERLARDLLDAARKCRDAYRTQHQRQFYK